MNTLKVVGMHCQNCVKAIKETLKSLPGAQGVTVDLKTGLVSWETMQVSLDEVKQAIEDIGFDVDECDDCQK